MTRTRRLLLKALAGIAAIAALGVGAHFLIRAVIAAHTG
jgi:hypothetical protein